MATKKTTSFSDRNAGLDDFNLDMEDYFQNDPGAAKQAKSHKPIYKVATNLGRGAIGHFYSEGFIRKQVAQGLPPGYDTAIETGYAIRDTTSQLYNTASSEYRKIEPALRRAVGRMVPESRNPLGKKLTEKLRAFSRGGAVGSPMGNSDEDNIRDALGEIFGIEMEANARARLEERVEGEINRTIDDRRFNSNMKALASIDARLARANAFNDQVFSKFQRRSLELQYRMLYTQRDTQKLLGQELGQTRQLLEAIVHNTALPDAVKMRARDRVGQGLRERLGGGAMSMASGFTRNFWKQFQDRMQGNIKGLFSGAHNALMGAEMGHEQLQMMREMGMDVSAQSSQALGGGIMNFLTQMMADGMNGTFKRTGWTAQHGAKAGRFAMNLPDMLAEWASKSSDTSSLKGRAVQWLKDQVPRKHQNRRIGGSAIMEAGEAGMFSKRFQRSVEEVMPGYLSQILHEVKQLRIGPLSDESRTVWNDDQSRFTSMKMLHEDIDNRMFNSKQVQFTRQQAESFVDKMLAGSKVSAGTHHALVQQIMADGLSGKKPDFRHYIRGSSSLTLLTPEQRREVRSVGKGRLRGSNGKLDQVTLQDLDRGFHGVRASMADVHGTMSAYHDLGHTEFLHQNELVSKVEDNYLANYDLMAKRMAGKAGTGTRESPFSRTNPEYAGNGMHASMVEMLNDVKTNLYRVGRMDEPVITPAMVTGGQLISAASGQPVRLMRHLIGGVLREGKVYLTADQVNRLVTVSGEKFPDWLARNTHTSQGSKVGQVFDKYVKNAGGTFDNFMDSTGQPYLDRLLKRGRGKAGAKASTVADFHARAAATVAAADDNAAAYLDAVGTKGTPQNIAAQTKIQEAAAAMGDARGTAKAWSKRVIAETKKLWRKGMAVGQFSVNLYRNGELKPLIDAKALKAGEYLNAKTGKPITDMREILDGVKDRTGKWVVTSQEAMDSLTTKSGERFVDIMDHAQASMQAAASTPTAQATSGAFTAIKDSVATHAVNAAAAHNQGSVFTPESKAPLEVNLGPLQEIVESFKEGNLDRLSAILETITSRDFATPGAGPAEGWREKYSKTKMGLLGRWGAGAVNGVGRMLKGAGTVYAKYVGAVGAGYKGAFKVGMWATGLPSEAVRQMNFATDVYVKGEKEPRLLAVLMEKGEYLDKDTGKPVLRPKDIKGAVVDSQGNTKLTQAELSDPGITNKYGKALIGKTLAGALKFGGKLFGAYGAVFGAYGSIIKGAVNLTGKAIAAARGARDVYVKGQMDHPKLSSTGFKSGVYFSMKTKKVIRSVGDIDGPVVDKEGNILLEASDIATGLVGVDGKPFRSLASRLGAVGKSGIGLGENLVTGYFKMAGGAVRLGANVLGGVMRRMGHFINPKGGWAGMGFGGGGPTSDETTHHLLEEILHLLDKRMPENEHYRAGSWQDEFAKRKAEREKDQEKRANDPTAKRGKGLFGSLAGLFGKKKEKDEDGNDINVDLGGGEKAAEKAAKKPGWFSRMKGKFGKTKWGAKLGRLGSKLGGTKLGRAGGKLIGGAGRAIGGIGRTAWNLGKLALGAGTLAEVGGGLAGIASGAGGMIAGAGSAVAGAASAVGTGLAAAGTVLGSILTAPVLIGAAVVAAAGVAAYYGYKYYDLKKAAPLRKLRMAQYGVDMNKDVWPADKVQKLEAMLEPHVVIQNGKASIDPKGVDQKEVLKLFDLAKSWYNPTGWFHKTTVEDIHQNDAFFSWLAHRFKPVFLAWRQAVTAVSPKTSVGDADSLSKEQKATLLKSVMNIDSSVYDVGDSPFKDEPIATGRKIVDAALAEAQKDVGDGKKPGAKAAGGAAVATATAAAMAGAKAAGAGTTTTDLAKKATAGVTAAMANTTGKGVGTGANLSASSQLNFTQQFLGNKVSALSAVRYKTYGATELTPERVKAFYLLENDVLTKVTYDGHGNAQFNEDVGFYFKEFCGYFGVSATDEKAKTRWYSWFAKRFIPTLLQFATAVKQANKNVDPQDAADRLGPQHLLDVANMTLAAVYKGGVFSSASVWTFTDSPFDESPLNTDSKVTEGNIEALKQAVKQRALTEQQAKVQSTKKDQIKSAADAAKGGSGSKAGDIWAGIKSGLGMGDDSKAQFKASASLPVGVEAGSAAGGRFAATGSINEPVGTPIKQPGNGTGGDINKLPEATGSGLANVKALLEAAGKMAGVDPDILATFAGIESSYNPMAKAGTSSASGMFQFINGTWKSMLARYGAKYGIDPRTPQTDARASALMGAEFIKENQRQLAQALGRQPSDTELYLAHFLGPAGAISMLKADPNAFAAAVNPSAASANAGIFYRQGQALSVANVLKILDGKVSKFRGKMSGTVASKDYAPPSTGGNTTTTANGPKGGIGALQINAQTKAPEGAASSATLLAGLTPNLTKPPKPSSGVIAGDLAMDPVAINQAAMTRKAMAADASAQSTNRGTQAAMGDLNKVMADQLTTQQGILATLKEMLTHTAALPGMAGTVGEAATTASNDAPRSGPANTGAARPPAGKMPAVPVSMQATRY